MSEEQGGELHPVSAASPLLDRTILVVHPDPRRAKELSQVMRTLTTRVTSCGSLADALEQDGAELLLVDYDSLPPAERTLLVERYAEGQRPSGRLLVSGGEECRRDFVNLFGTRTLTNLLGRNEPLAVEELVVTVRKLLGQDIFGIEKYFGWGVLAWECRLSRSDERGAIIDSVEKFARGLEVTPRLVELFCGATDELISNAIYNAPVDDQGQSRYRHVSRQEVVALEPHEHVALKFCSNGKRLGVSVTDPFGSLTRERLLEYLSRRFGTTLKQAEMKEGGAGLGLYQLFESLTHFVVNIEPGKRTEIIGIIDTRGSYRDFARTQKSFNVFVAE